MEGGGFVFRAETKEKYNRYFWTRYESDTNKIQLWKDGSIINESLVEVGYEWRWQRIVVNGDNIKVYHSDNGNDFVLKIDYVDNAYGGGYFGLRTSGGIWVDFDDFIVYGNLIEKIDNEQDIVVLSSFLDEDDDTLSSVRIEWLRNGIIQENLTQLSLDPKLESNNINNILLADYTAAGDEWVAIITICDIKDSCTSASTQKVRIEGEGVREDGTPLYAEKGEDKSNSISGGKITGFALSNVSGIARQKPMELVPIFLIAAIILDFMLREIKTAMMRG